MTLSLSTQSSNKSSNDTSKDEPCGFVCHDSTCKQDCDANAPYKTFQDCTSHCKTKHKPTLWIVLGVLGVVIVGVLVWVIVVHVKHTRHHYKVGTVVNDMRVAQGGTTVAPTLISH